MLTTELDTNAKWNLKIGHGGVSMWRGGKNGVWKILYYAGRNTGLDRIFQSSGFPHLSTTPRNLCVSVLRLETLEEMEWRPTSLGFNHSLLSSTSSGRRRYESVNPRE
jgi:hypothetical protein